MLTNAGKEREKKNDRKKLEKETKGKRKRIYDLHLRRKEKKIERI